MNSNSNCFLNKKNSNHKQCQDRDCQHPLGNKVLFESSYGNLGPLDVTFSEGASFLSIDQPIGRVTIDTTCVNVKNVIIDYVGILNVTTTVPATSTLNFTLYRSCNDQEMRQAISMISFLVADIDGGVTTSHTLAFRFPLGDDICNGCCSYVLELTNIFNLDFGTITYQINGVLSAMAIVSDR